MDLLHFFIFELGNEKTMTNPPFINFRSSLLMKENLRDIFMDEFVSSLYI